MDGNNPSDSRKRRRSNPSEQGGGEASPDPSTGAHSTHWVAHAQRLLLQNMAQNDIIHRAVATARASNNSLPPGNPAAPTATAASIATDSTLPQMHSLDRLRSANLALAQQAFQNQRVVEPTAPLLQLNTSSSAQFSALLASLGGMNQPRNTAVNPTGWSAGSPVALLTAAYPTIPPALSAQAPATAGLNPNSSAPSSNQAAVRDITESARTQALTEDDRPVQGPCCVLLYTPADDTMTSPYQCLARQQLEFFAAQQKDLEAGSQGRNRPIQQAQVGIRCIWCSSDPHRLRHRAFAYYPSKVVGIYQAAQNIVNTHLCQSCHKIPLSIRQELLRLKLKKSGSGGGRGYWVKSALSQGIIEVETGGLRYQSSSDVVEEDADTKTDVDGEEKSDSPKEDDSAQKGS